MEIWKSTGMNGKEHHIFFPVQKEYPNFISLGTDRIKTPHSLQIYSKVSCWADLAVDLSTDEQKNNSNFLN